MPRVTTTVLYPAGREAVAVGSTGLHRPTISPLGAPASLLANAAWHSSTDANILAGDVSSGLQTAWPRLHDSRTIIAAVAGSMCEFIPLWTKSQRRNGDFVSQLLKYQRVREQESGDVGSLGMQGKIKDPPPKPSPRKTPVRPDRDASPEPQHIDPPPRDVREAPAPNPNGDKKS